MSFNDISLLDTPRLRESSRRLHEDIARDMDVVARLFRSWAEDNAILREECRSCWRQFLDFDQALHAFNAAGKSRSTRSEHRDEEDQPITSPYHFARRRQTSSSLGGDWTRERSTATICTRCGRAIPRHGTYFVDVAAESHVIESREVGSLSMEAILTSREWHRDILCMPCIVYVMRQRLGENDDTMMMAIL